MTTAELGAIKARAEAATPGPWEMVKGSDQRYDVFREDGDTAVTDAGYGRGSIAMFEDVMFIAHAREDVPALVAEVERLRAALEAVSAVYGPGDYAHDTAHAALDGQAERVEVPSERPTVVCLCGSTRFYEAWQQANFDETVAGRIVLSVGFYPHAEDKAHAAHVGITPGQKVALDDLHKRKIDMADEILVLNVGGYVGDSTRSEIAYARGHGKRVRWLERTADALPGEQVPA